MALAPVDSTASSHSRERILWDEFHSLRRQCARNELLELYEPFARSMAARMYSSRTNDSVSFEDYIQYARVGLLEAVDRYDATRDTVFSAFAASRIRGSILNGLAKESEIAAQNRFWRTHAPARIGSLRTAVAPVAERASLAEVATITMGLALGVLLEESRESFEPADPNVNNNPYAATEVRQLTVVVRRLLARLPEKEQAVITGHYIEQIEFQDLAKRLSLSKGRVSQIHAAALLRLRSWLENSHTLDSQC